MGWEFSLNKNRSFVTQDMVISIFNWAACEAPIEVRSPSKAASSMRHVSGDDFSRGGSPFSIMLARRSTILITCNERAMHECCSQAASSFIIFILILRKLASHSFYSKGAFAKWDLHSMNVGQNRSATCSAWEMNLPLENFLSRWFARRQNVCQSALCVNKVPPLPANLIQCRFARFRSRRSSAAQGGAPPQVKNVTPGGKISTKSFFLFYNVLIKL